MTHPQVLSDEQIEHKLDTHVGGPNPSYPLDNSDWLNFARAIESATLAALGGQPVPQAMATVIKALKEDADYAWSWHCNVAMAAVDEGMEHYAANQAAARFMYSLANVDTTKHPGFPPAQPAPVPDEIISGVLFDFMGWLTSRDQRIVLSSTDHASPAVEAIQAFAKMRGIDLSNAAVSDWQARAALQAPAPQATKGQP